MAKYTIDLYTLLKDDNFKIFNFDYDFYTDDINIKQTFESKFIDRYMFNEIGFETVARFKHFLKERLNSIAPYYKQLYQTELESKNIKFLLNKDLTETFERIVENDGNNSTDMLSNNNGTQKSKESYLENGNADLGLNEGNLTGVSETSQNNTSNGSTSTNYENNQNEKTKLVSQGNIGVTSSAELLKQWREVLINIDNMIIEECRDLFMTIY